ncbi:uncharacterized protein LOC144689040 [Cetorhinus maximus]
MCPDRGILGYDSDFHPFTARGIYTVTEHASAGSFEEFEAKEETLANQLQNIQGDIVKEMEIVDQKETIAGLQNQISDLNKENGNVQGDLVKLMKQFSIQEQQLSKVTGYLQGKQGDVDELTSQNSRLRSQLIHPKSCDDV